MHAEYGLQCTMHAEYSLQCTMHAVHGLLCKVRRMLYMVDRKRYFLRRKLLYIYKEHVVIILVEKDVGSLSVRSQFQI